MPPRLVSLQGRSRVLPFPHSGGKSGTTFRPPSLGPIPPRESPSGSLPVRSLLSPRLLGARGLCLSVRLKERKKERKPWGPEPEAPQARTRHHEGRLGALQAWGCVSPAWLRCTQSGFRRTRRIISINSSFQLFSSFTSFFFFSLFLFSPFFYYFFFFFILTAAT